MAAAIIVAHNHPSGTLRPSQADIDLTRKMKTVGEAIGLPLVDHIIIADGGYYSFLDEGLI
jgi:DNA repair protein RadC